MFWRKKSKTDPTSEVAIEIVELPKRNLTKSIRSIFSRVKFDLEDLTVLEETLIQSDFGVAASAELVEELKLRARRASASSESELKSILSEMLVEKLSRTDTSLNLNGESQPYVILVVGVNGAGKTTTIGKLAKYLSQGGAKVTLGAADTFRAAAVEQLATWAERSGAQIVRPKAQGQDPASVAFETVETALANQSDIVIIDTAGRLQNKQGLMDELGKIRRIIEKKLVVSEVLLVLDATNGQNALAQAKSFTEVAQVTGLVLTKLDGSAKGGIIYSIQQTINIPVKLIGVGEGIDDFGFFNPTDFVTALLGEE